MKKFLCIILSGLIIISLVPAVYAGSADAYIVAKDVAAVYKIPSITSDKLCEVTKNTYLEITDIRSGFGYTFIAKDGVWGWIQLGALTPLEAPEPDTNIKEIKIKTLPEKLVYTDGKEELDLTGLTLVSVDKQNREAYITGYSVFAPEMKIPGEKTITVTYSPDNVNTFSAEFTVTVKRLPVTALSVKAAPKTSYMENALLDLSGLIVELHFANEAENRFFTFEQIKNNPDFTVSGCHGENHGSVLSKGEHTVRIEYKYDDIFCDISISVTPRKLIGLTLKSPPENLTVYDNTKIPALNGLILEAEYDNGEKEDVYHYSCIAVCNPEEFAIGPGNQVKVYFGELFVTVEFRYSVAEPEKIVIEFKDKDGNIVNTNFPKGEIIDLGGIRVRLVYSDDTFVYTDEYTISTPDPTILDAKQNIVVTYREFSEIFSITISSSFSKGDVDGDGKISANDARQALRAAVGLVKLSGKTLFAGDADRDGTMTSSDARLILRAAVGLENLYITL